MLVLFAVVGPRLAQLLALVLGQVVAEHDGAALRGRALRGLVGQVRAQIRLAQVRLVDGEVHVLGVHGHRVDRDVRRDADALDGEVPRRQILRDGQLERRAVFLVVVEDLHRALAEAGLPDDERAVVILERAGDDLRRGSRAAVDQHDHRVVGLGALGDGFLHVALRWIVRRGRDDHAARQEGVRDAHRLVEQAARVVPQVEDEAAHITLSMELRERALHILEGVALEALDLDVADVAAEHPRLDRLDVDDRADEVEAAGRGPAVRAFAHDVHADARAGRAAQAADGLVERQVEGRLLVDLHDAVTAHQACARGGRPGHRTDDRQLPIAQADDDAEAAELAARRHAHLGVDLGRQEHRVRVERAEHSVDRRVLDLVEIDVGAGEVLLQEREDLAKMRAEIPGRADIVDVELAVRVVHADGQRRGALRVVDHHRRDRALNGVEPGEQHALRVHALGLDVVVLHMDDHRVKHAQFGQIVGRRRVRSLRARRAVDVEVEPVATGPDEGDAESHRYGHEGGEGHPEPREVAHGTPRGRAR